MTECDYGTPPYLAKRAKADNLPISEYTIRQLIKKGLIPARYIGRKSISSYSALVRYLSCQDGQDNTPATGSSSSGIRRIEAG